MTPRRSLASFAYVAVPKLFGGACLVVLNLILLRFLGPGEYGIYSVCLTAILLLSEALVGAALDLGVVRFATVYRDSDPRRAFDIERVAFRTKLAAAGLVGLLAVAMAEPLSRFLFRQPGLGPLIGIVSGAALSNLCFGSVLVHLQVRERFRGYGLLDLSQMALKFGAIAGLLLWVRWRGIPLNPAWILASFALAPALVCGGFLCGGTALVSPARLAPGVAAELLSYVRWNLFTFVLAAVVSRMDVLLVSSLAGTDQAGLLAAGLAIASIPPMFGSYLAIVLNPKVIPLIREGRFFRFFRRTQGLLWGGSILALLIGIPGLHLLGSWLFPPAFSRSIGVILILLPSSLASMTSFPLVVSFLMFTRPRFLITLECSLLPLVLGMYILGIGRYGAVGAAVVTSAFILLKTLIAQGVAYHLARRSPQELGFAANPSELPAAGAKPQPLAISGDVLGTRTEDTPGFSQEMVKRP